MNTTVSSAHFLNRFHQRIAEKTASNSARTVIIAALGDSVTAGLAGEGEFLHGQVYHGQLKELLEERYPQCVFSVINAGDGGQNAGGGFQLLERDVLHHQPDLLLISFGLNDAHAGFDGLDAYAANLTALINRAREATEADIILLTPNMMPHHENDNIPDRWREGCGKFIALQTEGVLAAYAQRVREAGVKNNLPVADVYAAWEALEAAGQDTTALLANGLNHPDARGHRIAAQILMEVVVNHEKGS